MVETQQRSTVVSARRIVQALLRSHHRGEHMGSSLSTNDDEVVCPPRKLVFPDDPLPGRRRTPLGQIAENQQPRSGQHPLKSPAGFLSPGASLTARKDDAMRRKALAALRGEAVQTAVAEGLARAAASGSSRADLEALRRLQKDIHTIADASTESLGRAASELDAVHRRQVDRARRNATARASATDVIAPAAPVPELEGKPTGGELAQAATPATTVRPSRAAQSSRSSCEPIDENQHAAPVPLSRPRSTPSAAGSPPSTDHLNSPEAVRAYLAQRKAQLAEQKVAASAMRDQLSELLDRQRSLRDAPPTGENAQATSSAVVSSTGLVSSTGSSKASEERGSLESARAASVGDGSSSKSGESEEVDLGHDLGHDLGRPSSLEGYVPFPGPAAVTEPEQSGAAVEAAAAAAAAVTAAAAEAVTAAVEQMDEHSLRLLVAQLRVELQAERVCKERMLNAHVVSVLASRPAGALYTGTLYHVPCTRPLVPLHCTI